MVVKKGSTKSVSNTKTNGSSNNTDEVDIISSYMMFNEVITKLPSTGSHIGNVVSYSVDDESDEGSDEEQEDDETKEFKKRKVMKDLLNKEVGAKVLITHGLPTSVKVQRFIPESARSDGYTFDEAQREDGGDDNELSLGDEPYDSEMWEKDSENFANILKNVKESHQAAFCCAGWLELTGKKIPELKLDKEETFKITALPFAQLSQVCSGKDAQVAFYDKENILASIKPHLTKHLWSCEISCSLKSISTFAEGKASTAKTSSFLDFDRDNGRVLGEVALIFPVKYLKTNYIAVTGEGETFKYEMNDFSENKFFWAAYQSGYSCSVVPGKQGQYVVLTYNIHKNIKKRYNTKKGYRGIGYGTEENGTEESDSEDEDYINTTMVKATGCIAGSKQTKNKLAALDKLVNDTNFSAVGLCLSKVYPSSGFTSAHLEGTDKTLFEYFNSKADMKVTLMPVVVYSHYEHRESEYVSESLGQDEWWMSSRVYTRAVFAFSPEDLKYLQGKSSKPNYPFEKVPFIVSCTRGQKLYKYHSRGYYLRYGEEPEMDDALYLHSAIILTKTGEEDEDDVDEQEEDQEKTEEDLEEDQAENEVSEAEEDKPKSNGKKAANSKAGKSTTKSADKDGSSEEEVDEEPKKKTKGGKKAAAAKKRKAEDAEEEEEEEKPKKRSSRGKKMAAKKNEESEDEDVEEEKPTVKATRSKKAAAKKQKEESEDEEEQPQKKSSSGKKTTPKVSAKKATTTRPTRASSRR